MHPSPRQAASRFLTPHWLLCAFSFIAIVILKPPSGLAQSPDQEAFDAGALPNEAADQPRQRLIPWRGLVQFESGEFARLESSGQRTALHHRDAIYEGDRIELKAKFGGKGGLAKIKAREGCIFAIFANKSPFIVLPPDSDHLWRFRGDAMRAYCPAGAQSNFEFRGARVSLTENSELLFDSGRVLALSGTVQIRGSGTLATMTIHRYDTSAKKWVSEGQDAKKTYDFASIRPKIAEGKVVERPPETADLRIILGPSGGSSRVTFDNDELDSRSRDAGGGRVQLHFRSGEKSWIAMLHFRGTESGDQGPPPPESARVSSELLGLEFGVRTNHERWWSPFFRAGFGYEKTKVDLSYSSASVFRNDRYEFYSITGAAGVDAFWSPPTFSWAGVYGSAEAHLSQSIGRGARENFGNYSGPSAGNIKAAEEPWRATVFSFLFHIGVMFQF